jgi:predicted nucleic acid-binding protein
VKLFLDANVIIYWVESAEPFYTRFISVMQSLYVKYPHASFAISRLSFLECRVKPLKENNREILSLFDNFFNAHNLLIIELDAHVINITTHLKSQHLLRTPDALQVACALSLLENEEILFITGDIRIKNISNLSICYI